MLKNLDVKQILVTMVVTMGSIAVYEMVVKPMISKPTVKASAPVIPMDVPVAE